MKPPPPTYEAVIKRTFPHPLSRVYRAWTQPEHVAAWLKPGEEVSLTVVSFDLRVGGEYHFRYEHGVGIFPVRGKFLTLEPERLIIFTWRPYAPHPDADKDTMVSVWFRSLQPDSTEVELRHTLFPDEPMCQCHEKNWWGTLEQLSRYLAGHTQQSD
ncbi:MAG: SRPBCC domain-containing protein [Opitutae bacterium]|nr:SRPBCC domain-containing protein [Opitutae bacterium]